MELNNELNQENELDSPVGEMMRENLNIDPIEYKPKYELDLRDSDMEDDDPREIYY
jgi:hypothetical protein